MKKIEKRENGSIRVCTINNEPDMCEQQYEKECDVNHILRNLEKTGQITHIKRQQGVYEKLGTPKTLMEAINQVKRSDEAFMSLPAEIRAKLDHDPVKFLQVLKDGSMDDDLTKLGVISKKQAESGKPDPQPSDSAVVNSKKDA